MTTDDVYFLLNPPTALNSVALLPEPACHGRQQRCSNAHSY